MEIPVGGRRNFAAEADTFVDGGVVSHDETRRRNHAGVEMEGGTEKKTKEKRKRAALDLFFFFFSLIGLNGGSRCVLSKAAAAKKK